MAFILGGIAHRAYNGSIESGSARKRLPGEDLMGAEERIEVHAELVSSEIMECEKGVKLSEDDTYLLKVRKLSQTREKRFNSLMLKKTSSPHRGDQITSRTGSKRAPALKYSRVTLRCKGVNDETCYPPQFKANSASQSSRLTSIERLTRMRVGLSTSQRLILDQCGDRAMRAVGDMSILCTLDSFEHANADPSSRERGRDERGAQAVS
eukprot:4153512-Pleurochrysis_carterae.AAC.2